MNRLVGFDWKQLTRGKNGQKLTREAVRNSLGMPIWGMFLFGIPFFLIGVWVTLASLRIAGLHMKSASAPDWVLTVFGISFAAAGILVWGMAWNSHRKTELARKVATENPNQPAMQDYPWELTGSSSLRWWPFIKVTLSAVGLTIFLSIFNWMAFGEAGNPFFVKIIVGIFDLILIFLWWQTYVTFVRALKFGSSRLAWATFPLRPENVQLNWKPGEGMGTWDRAIFTLRCIQETWETVRTSKGTKERASHEELWSQVVEKDKPGKLTRKDSVPLNFTIPEAIPGSYLKAESPIFWELEVELEVPGVNFQSRFLVPIYRVNELAEH